MRFSLSLASSKACFLLVGSGGEDFFYCILLSRQLRSFEKIANRNNKTSFVKYLQRGLGLLKCKVHGAVHAGVYVSRTCHTGYGLRMAIKRHAVRTRLA